MRTVRRKGALARLESQLSAGTKAEKVLDEKTNTRKTTDTIVKLTDKEIGRITAEIKTLKLRIGGNVG